MSIECWSKSQLVMIHELIVRSSCDPIKNSKKMLIFLWSWIENQFSIFTLIDLASNAVEVKLHFDRFVKKNEIIFTLINLASNAVKVKLHFDRFVKKKEIIFTLIDLASNHKR
jgi:hypothetical protein